MKRGSAPRRLPQFYVGVFPNCSFFNAEVQRVTRLPEEKKQTPWKGRPVLMPSCLFILLKLINYSYCYQPTRTAHSGQVDEFRNPMKNELKTTRV